MSQDGPDLRDELAQTAAPPRRGVFGLLRRRRAWVPVLAGAIILGLVAGGVVRARRDQTPPPAFPLETLTPAAPSPTPTPTPTPSPSPTSTPTPTPTPTPEPVWPLTGLPHSGELGPSLCVKIENAANSRPQLGLDVADIVFEEVVEGGITRYMAVYQSVVPPQVEPVRSLRPMDAPLAQPFGCALVFSGAQPQFIDAAAASGLQLMIMDRGDKGFSRDRKRAAPHNVIGDMITFLEQVDPARQTPAATAFQFAATGGPSTAGATGVPTARLSLELSSIGRPHWDWDDAAGQWLRFEGSKPAVVMGGTQLHATNLVALFMEVHNTPYKDPVGTPVPETRVVGAGTGVVGSQGKTIPVNWSKDAPDQPIRLTDLAGAPVLLAPGNTWVELVPTTGSITPA